MARTGLYKSEVKKARDSLVSQGKHPSVDAVRIALGNTGSKTTIHKYLKELEEDDGGQALPATISEALQNLVGQLAMQLQVEADAKVSAARLEVEEMGTRLNAELTELRLENTALTTKLADAEASTAEEKEAHQKTSSNLEERSTALLSLQVQATALRERLAENERHRLSLEEKHQHARESLEHYRAATKEQRDQDLRRHEAQVQALQAEIRQLRQDAIIKAEDVTRLNQDGVRLVAELSHAKQALYEAQTKVRDQAGQLEKLKAVNARNELLREELIAKDALYKESVARTNQFEREKTEAMSQLSARDVQIAGLQAQIATQASFANDLHLFLEKRSAS